MLAQFGHLAVHLMSKVFITNCTMSRIWVVFELVHLNHHPTYISISNMYESQNPDLRIKCNTIGLQNQLTNMLEYKLGT